MRGKSSTRSLKRDTVKNAALRVSIYFEDFDAGFWGRPPEGINLRNGSMEAR